MKLWGSEAALAREEKSSDSGEIWLWGFGVVWRALLQEVKHRSVQTHTETGCQSSTRHRRLRGPPRLSWLRDLEPAQSRPPSRSRPVQPCRQRVPFPPHLWDDTHCCTIISHRKQNVMRMRTITPPKAPDSCSPGIIFTAVFTSFQFWAFSNFQSRMKLLLSVTTGPWGGRDTQVRREDHSQSAVMSWTRVHTWTCRTSEKLRRTSDHLLTALLTAIRRLASPPKRFAIILETGTYAMGMTSMGTPFFHCWPRALESFLRGNEENQ